MLNIVEITKCIADYLPPGVAWLAKRIQDSNTYLFLKSIAQYLSLFFLNIEKLKDEMSPDTTIDLIDRWEREFGIPDDCINVLTLLQDRRNNVLLKMAGLGVQTDADFEALALKLGATCVCWRDGIKKFTIYFDLPAAWGPIVFPLPFPYPFGSRYGIIIECLFTKLIPANCEAVFRYVL